MKYFVIVSECFIAKDNNFHYATDQPISRISNYAIKTNKRCAADLHMGEAHKGLMGRGVAQRFSNPDLV